LIREGDLAEETSDAAKADDIHIISLGPGDLLIQPAGTVHAPCTMKDALVTGTMHWDSRELARIMLLALYERDYRKMEPMVRSTHVYSIQGHEANLKIIGPST
jgi:hypothetical protein